MSRKRALAAGSLLADRYKLESKLGEGGFGEVFRARDLSLERSVAIKILNDDDLGAGLPRFVQEARAAAQLQSEHVATIFEVGSTPDGVAFIAMELLRGRDLRDELLARGPLPLAEVVDIALQAALGVAHAHARGIVHRDLKPRNLFRVTRDDGSTIIKVLDFGIAKRGGSQLTQTNETLGTPQYMAPEQLRSSRNADVRTDIWALGVVLYELACNKLQYDVDSTIEFIAHVLGDPPIPLRARNKAIDPAFEAIVDRCLEKEPARRFADLGALARALAPLAPDSARSLVGRIERVLASADVTQASERRVIANDAETVRTGAGTSAEQAATVPSPPPRVERPTREMPVVAPTGSRWRPIAFVLGGIAVGAATVFAVIKLGGGDEPMVVADEPPLHRARNAADAMRAAELDAPPMRAEPHYLDARVVVALGVDARRVVRDASVHGGGVPPDLVDFLPRKRAQARVASIEVRHAESSYDAGLSTRATPALDAKCAALTTAIAKCIVGEPYVHGQADSMHVHLDAEGNVDSAFRFVRSAPRKTAWPTPTAVVACIEPIVRRKLVGRWNDEGIGTQLVCSIHHKSTAP